MCSSRAGVSRTLSVPVSTLTIGLFVDLERVSSAAVDFIVTDEELITKDKQRIGLVVTGDVFRPGLAQRDTIQGLWAQYNQLYSR